MSTFVRLLDEVGKEDVRECRGKGANLGELTRLGVRVPPGFCVLSAALPYVLGGAHVLARIRECWASLWTTRAAFVRHQQDITTAV